MISHRADTRCGVVIDRRVDIGLELVSHHDNAQGREREKEIDRQIDRERERERDT